VKGVLGTLKPRRVEGLPARAGLGGVARVKSEVRKPKSERIPKPEV